MLGQRRRRWTNIEPTLVQRIVFAGHNGLLEKTTVPGRLLKDTLECDT